MKLRPQVSRIVVGTVAAVALAACGGGDGGGSGAADGGGDNALTVEAGDMYFEPETLSADAGSITIEMDNVGGAEHTFVMDDTDETVVAADPGAVGTGTVELEAGTHTFYCDVPGHREAGMEGTLELS